MPQPEEAEGWPFWAPSDLAVVDAGLDLARLRSGDRLIDLGCGDGQVLVAAARRGAHVVGVEVDDELAATAEEALAAEGLDGKVIVGDLFELDLDADVVFTYLAPATLQRLAPIFDGLPPGTRVVTVDFLIPGVRLTRHEGRAHLYRTPLRRLRPKRPRWPSAAGLVVAVPERQSLTVLELHHPGGPVRFRADGAVAELADFLTGADTCEPGQALALDIRWEGWDAGTLATGTLRMEGLPPFPFFVYFAEDEDNEGLWSLTADGAVNIAGKLASGWRPTDAEALVTAADG
jgi:SAM-dependent methyltransferase